MANHHSGPAARPDMTGPGEGKIRCSHLLVKHRESRRPSSWREAEITRPKEEAIQILLGHEQRIKSGEASLGDIAVSESDCSSARKKGDLYVMLNIISCPTCQLTITVVSLDAMRCKRSLKTQPLPCSRARSAALLKPRQVSTSLSGMSCQLRISIRLMIGCSVQ